MEGTVLGLLATRAGHFLYESGHHGDRWLDLDALWTRPARLRPALVELGRRLAGHDIDGICGPLTGGAFVAIALAVELDLSCFVTERIVEPGNGPVRYALPVSLREQVRGRRLAVVDDAINAGSATGGTVAALDAAGAITVAIGVLLTLGERPHALATARGVPLESIARLPSNLWLPAACPLCRDGIPLESLVR
jgi:orotate phosphoribosyltransferase